MSKLELSEYEQAKQRIEKLGKLKEKLKSYGIPVVDKTTKEVTDALIELI